MTYAVQAIYENGVFRPLTKLPLPEHERVELEIRPMETSHVAPRKVDKDPVSVVRETAGMFRLDDDDLAYRIAMDEDLGPYGDVYEDL